MRVAVHSGQLLQRVPGGIGRYVAALLAHLPAAGVEPIAFAAGANPDGLPAGARWVDLGAPRGALRYELWHRLRRPRVPVEADVVHAPSLAVPPAGDRPLVVTVHDVGFLHGSWTTRRGRAFHTRGLELARREATVVISVSRFTRDALIAEGFAPSRVRVVPLGCDPPLERTDAEIDAELAALGVGSPFVLAVGTVEPRKNLPVLADAVTALRETRPELSLLVVGPDGWGRVAGLDRPGVHRLGALPWRALDALYRRADVSCLPSAYEGFGLPALEALARGSPLVATHGSALTEVVGDAALLVPPGDPDALVHALGLVLADTELRADLARRGPAQAAQFTWTRTARAHAEAYRAALETPGPDPADP